MNNSLKRFSARMRRSIAERCVCLYCNSMSSQRGRESACVICGCVEIDIPLSLFDWYVCSNENLVSLVSKLYPRLVDDRKQREFLGVSKQEYKKALEVSTAYKLSENFSLRIPCVDEIVRFLEPIVETLEIG